MNSDTQVTCDPGVYWKLIDAAPNFGEQIPIVGQKETTIKNLSISGIDYFGNYTKQTKTENDHGLGFGNLFGFKNIYNSKFFNINIHDTEGDGFRLEVGSGIDIYNCKADKYGHDFVHLSQIVGTVDNPSNIHDNYVRMRTNNVLRTRACHHVNFYNNSCLGTDLDYGSAVQVENKTKTTSYINVYGNLIRDTLGSGIWITGMESKDTNAAKKVTIKNNLFINCGIIPAANKIPNGGGISCDGFTDVLIENNTFDACMGYGIVFAPWLGSSAGKGYKATVRKNIFTNTVHSWYKGTKSGCALANLLPAKYTVVAEENCYWNNEAGDLYNITDAKAIRADPCYVGSGDYHLKSIGGHFTKTGTIADAVTSPCIKETYELGRYAGTKESSVYVPPPSDLTPDDLVGDNPAVIIICPSAKGAYDVANAIRKSGILNEEKVVEFYPNGK